MLEKLTGWYTQSALFIEFLTDGPLVLESALIIMCTHALKEKKNETVESGISSFEIFGETW